MKRSHPYALAALLLLAPALGCAGDETPAPVLTPAEAAERDSLLVLLQSVRQDVFRAAFAALPAYDFTRYSRTEQLSRTGDVVAYRERTVQYATRDGERLRLVQAADTAGTFSFGLLGRFISESGPSDEIRDVVAYLLPEDPPYLSVRNRDAYLYRMTGDTLLGGRRARIIDIQARPGEDNEQPLRHARLYVDAATEDLLALLVERSMEALLFQEESTLFLSLQEGPLGDWVPHRALFQSTVDGPLLPPRSFRTRAAYDDLVPAGVPTAENAPRAGSR